MSNTGKKYAHDQALLLAGWLVNKLYPYCDRIAIAGSLRRGAKRVGDIELVIIPSDQRLFTVLDNMLGDETLKKRTNKRGYNIAWGTSQRCAWVRHPQGHYIALDLFFTTVDQWGLTYAIRTGNAEISKKIVSQVSIGGFLPNHMVARDWRIWKLAGRTVYTKGMDWRSIASSVQTREEFQVFQLFGMPFIQPYERSDERNLLSWIPKTYRHPPGRRVFTDALPLPADNVFLPMEKGQRQPTEYTTDDVEQWAIEEYHALTNRSA